MAYNISTDTFSCDVCGGESMNTAVDYLYRDASNYKVRNRQIVEGVLTDEQIKEIMESCDDGEYFVPVQVGFPEERFSDVTDDDHPWFELLGASLTDAKPTVSLTAGQLYRNFIKASGNWDETLWEMGSE